ncbi:nitrogen fixation protein NifX [Geomonas sp. Red32]|uniref:NifB/NifX family molybdenum-iron cluster-binding protein n=1 Tax=Geomonas sp. Red32 TaxID=2912856 RepID=UPI00202CBCF2|nr:NifB/NifX family molybdenum-iron cluster-binding protein [Geomonas sp. Red32]MCM0084135.1 nitrogen fixation protein NifX [Geomonas sp. Red32]
MKVAFATSTGTLVDEEFRNSRSFTVWHIGPREAYFVNQVTIEPEAATEEGRLAARATVLAGCAIVCSRHINVPAAAKLAARGIHPMRTGSPVQVEEIIGQLQSVLKKNPPPWMGRADSRERFR